MLLWSKHKVEDADGRMVVRSLLHNVTTLSPNYQQQSAVSEVAFLFYLNFYGCALFSLMQIQTKNTSFHDCLLGLYFCCRKLGSSSFRLMDVKAMQLGVFASNLGCKMSIVFTIQMPKPSASYSLDYSSLSM